MSPRALWIAAALWCAAAPAAAQQPLSDAGAAALLRSEHVDGGKIPEGAGLDRALAALGDPWTRRYDAAGAAAFAAEVGGTARRGVGLPELLSVDLDGADGKTPVVVAPLPGSPADRAGLAPGDRIVAVGGKPAADLGWDALMAGLRRDPVRLRVSRDGRERDVTLRRVAEKPGGPTVRARRQGGVLHLAIGRFTAGTPAEVRAALARAGELPIVVDLRRNPGGDVAAVLAVAGLLVGPAPVATLEGPGGRRTPLSGDGEALPHGAVVVLVDEGTASAAEVLAAGLRAAAGAPVVGAHTTGKCLVHAGAPLEGGGLLLYTAGRLGTLAGASICDGLDPDEEAQGKAALALATRRLSSREPPPGRRPEAQ